MRSASSTLAHPVGNLKPPLNPNNLYSRTIRTVNYRYPIFHFASCSSPRKFRVWAANNNKHQHQLPDPELHIHKTGPYFFSYVCVTFVNLFSLISIVWFCDFVFYEIVKIIMDFRRVKIIDHC